MIMLKVCATEVLEAQMKNTESELKQIKLKNFCIQYDVPRTTALKWIHSDGFPAYNICGHWYVDISKYLKWREEQHINKSGKRRF